jgi:hypothetical protein
MVESGDRKCIDGDQFVFRTREELECDVLSPHPDDIPDLLASIDAGIKRLVAIKEDDAWDPIQPGSPPYGILKLSYDTGTVNEEIPMPVPARAIIIETDQTITLKFYKVNYPEIPLQKSSGTVDYMLKVFQTWGLPKSRAIDRIFLTNISGSTVNIYITIWG